MIKGAGNTISVVLFAIAASTFLGLLIGVARLSANPLVNRMGLVYVELFRNLPLLLIMFFFAFAAFRALPRIEEELGVGRLLYISNRGIAIPWLQTDNQFWWVWLLAVAVAAIVGWQVRKRRDRREDETGQVLRPNSWGLGCSPASPWSLTWAC